jgi:prepilin-type N-terminal cleavage/methylation domain-containing protein
MTLTAQLQSRRSQLKAQRRNPFTLLELLVVVAIIAIIAGAIISSYDGVDANAAAATSAHTTGSSDQVMRQYAYVNNTMPDNYETGLDDAGALHVTLPSSLTANSPTVPFVAPFTLLANHVSNLSLVSRKAIT